MTDEWRIRELLEQILESNCEPEAACAECPELLSTVRQRLERMRQVEQQLDAIFPASSGENAAPAMHSPGANSSRLPQIDGYEVEGILGRGGMGIVYRARHLKLNRIVALKMLLSGPYASPQEVARFVRESQAVAELQHPHIVQVHDVGNLDGRPFFTMEFVAGASLADKLAGMPQPARYAAELVAILAGAVHAAHAQGIIHRDLKPANILLTGDGTPKIADFGLARHIDGDPGLTRSDARVGTPSYMAPEQALGKLGIVGPSVDIYALGAILYEMLTGRPPFRAETAIETERQVITVEAAPPSRLNVNIPRNLETICLKCLHKDPARRYASAIELAEDLRRFLDGQPVRARPVGNLERAWSWGKRNQTVAAALSGVALLLLLIVAGSVWAAAHFRRLEREHRQLAREKGVLADQKGRLVTEKERERQKAVSAETRQVELRKQSQAQGQELRRNLYLTEMNLAGQAAAVPSGLGRVGELLATWGLEQPDLRNWEWYYLNSLCHRNALTLMAHVEAVHKVAWSPNGKQVASAGADRSICIWDATEELPPLRLRGHDREVISVTWSPDGQRLASCSWDLTVRIWDPATGAEVLRFSGHSAPVYAVAWSHDGKTIASAGDDRIIQIWDAADGTRRNVLPGHQSTVTSLVWKQDGRRLISGSRDTSIRIWELATGQSIHTLIGHTNWVNQVAWSPDGTRLASASNDQTLRIWDADNGQELLKLRGHTQGIAAVAWSPDGTRLATSSDDQTVKVWSAATGSEDLSFRGHSAPLTTVAWNPQGDRIASGGYDRTVRIWDVSSGAETPALTSHQVPIHALAWCQRDTTLCASADAAGLITVWDMARQKQRWTWQADKELIHSVAWHPAGTRLAVGSGDGLIRIWTVSADTPAVLEGHAGEVSSVAWSPDGRRLASGGYDRSIRIWDVQSGQVSRVINNHTHSVYTIAWSPDGRQLASASGDRTVKIWNVATGEEVRSYRGHTSEVVTVAWSPDGSTLASAGYDQSVQLWNVSNGQRTATLRGHSTHVAQVIWSPDGTRLASAGRDGALKVWDTATGKEALTLNSHTSQVNAVAWSPDGMTLASAGEDHQIRIHDAHAGYVAARARQSLPAIDRRLSADPSRSADWRLRAEIHVRGREWSQASADLRQYLLLNSHRNWFMFDGYVAGPYHSDLKLRFLPEKTDFFGLQELDADDARRVNWKPSLFSAQGTLNFGSVMEHQEFISAYVLFPIYSLNDHSVAVLLGSDDQAHLWLNGQLQFESMRSRTAVPDEDAIPVTLKSGWNSLLVEVANEAGDHALYLRLSDSASDMLRIRSKKK